MQSYNPGEDILLYARFENDLLNNSFLSIPTVEVLQIKDNKINSLLNATMQTTDYKDFYYTFTLPSNCSFGEYQVIYTGYLNGKEHKVFESFYVVNYQNNVNPIRLYGYVYDDKTHSNISNVNVELYNAEDNITYTCTTNLVGQWECYVYSGEFEVNFKHSDYHTKNVVAKISNELQQLEFNNITLEKITIDKLGNGIHEIKEQYTLKNGQPIEGLNVLIYDITDLSNELINTYTNDDGYWYAYLDSGNYLLKLNGIFKEQTYDKTFRLRVQNNGDFNMQDISSNYATDSTIFVGNGDGNIEYTDTVLDKNNKPIPDVQVNILNNKNEIQYQYYTDLEGKFKFNLNEGTYTIEFYHPSFKTITQTISVK